MSRFVPAHRAGAAFAVSITLVSLVAPAAAAAEPRAVSYVPPMDAPVVDGFRPPESRFSAGNRGIDYASAAGDPVHSAAPGRVVFAGRIGSQFHVTVLHDDGIRTSYSFLRDVVVRRGDHVRQGQVLGAAGGRMHFGARAGEAYLDPGDLFAGDLPAIRLVPLETLPPIEIERGWLQRIARQAATAAGAAAEWAGERATGALQSGLEAADARLRLALHYVRVLAPPLVAADLALQAADAVADWNQHALTCTPADAAPPRPSRRRMAVLIGGLGSSSAALARRGGVAGIDAGALGFAAGDTYYFSYQGGHIGERGYGPEDTENGFAESGAKLRAFLSRLERDNPGVPIVLIAHSQGGLVARDALSRGAGTAVTDLVTLGTPHNGADPATLLASIRATAAGPLVDAAGKAFAGVDPGSASVRELSETSDFIRHLPPVPPRVRLTSIAADGDLIVPTPRARVEGADNRIVTPAAGFHDHDALPRDAGAQREVALALAGRAETCRPRTEFVLQRLRGHLTGLGVDAAGALATAVLSATPARLP